MPRLSAIYRYPVKSCGGESLEAVKLDRFGPSGDRRWMLVDAGSRFVSQREDASLALLSAAHSSGALLLSHAGGSLEVPIPESGATCEVTVWNDQVGAIDAGDEVAAWLSAALQRELRLVYMPDSADRRVDTDYARDGETVSFADGFPLLLISQAALDVLNGKLSHAVPMDRFRPNLVVSGCPAHAEDAWKRVRIGELEFDVAKPCARCVMPSIDQATAQKDSEILRVLADYRRGADRQVYFGQNLLYRDLGTLRVGDEVEVLD